MSECINIITVKHRVPLLRCLHELGKESRDKADKTGIPVPCPCRQFTDSRVAWRAGYERANISFQIVEEK